MEIFGTINVMYEYLFALINKVLEILKVDFKIEGYGFDPETGKFGKLEEITK